MLQLGYAINSLYALFNIFCFFHYTDFLRVALRRDLRRLCCGCGKTAPRPAHRAPETRLTNDQVGDEYFDQFRRTWS